jgi:hypothetical protein
MTGKELLERWESTKILTGIEDTDRKFAVATCLEMQRRVNETFDDGNSWKRCSIPVIRRVFSETRNLFMNEDFDNLDNKVNYQFLKTKFEVPDCTVDGKYDLNLEAEYVAKFSEDIRNELNEMFRDTPRKQIKFYGLRATHAGVIVYS